MPSSWPHFRQLRRGDLNRLFGLMAGGPDRKAWMEALIDCAFDIVDAHRQVLDAVAVRLAADQWVSGEALDALTATVAPSSRLPLEEGPPHRSPGMGGRSTNGMSRILNLADGPGRRLPLDRTRRAANWVDRPPDRPR